MASLVCAILATSPGAEPGDPTAPPSTAAAGSGADAGAEAAGGEERAPFALLGAQIAPGTRRRLGWHANADAAGVRTDTPVMVVHGARPGPVLCLASAVHGDELNGIEIVRRIVHTTKPESLAGTLIGVPIVNLSGFQRASRYLPDRRDLNRYFPGHPAGSLASRIAHSFFEDIVRACDRLVDLHTGSFHRTNLPQLRADLGRPEVAEMTRGFGAISVMHSRGGDGTLRRAATEAGVPSVTIEAGEPLRLQENQVLQGVEAIESYMAHLEMTSRLRIFGAPQPIYYETSWVRANRSGILLGGVQIGDAVDRGQVLARVVDPVTNEQETLQAPFDGRVLGMALNQMVLPGFAAFRIGRETREESLAAAAAEQESAAEDVDADEAGRDGDASEVPAPRIDDPEALLESEIHDP